MFRVVLLLCVAFAHGTPIPDLVPRFRLFGDERIVGGAPINIKDVPYQVTFQRLNRHMCGGSIISETHILTAAHCSIIDPNVNNLIIGTGSDDLNAVTKHKVAKNSRNSKYDSNSIDYDVAVLKLAEKLTLGPSVALVALSTEEPADGEVVMVTGWGTLKSGGQITTQLNSVDVGIINRKVCEKAYSNFNPITSRMICAGVSAGGKDSCQGDSGGPMVSKKTKKQVGIVSWGYGCARPDYPGVYTDVSDKAIQEFVQAQLKL